MRAEDMTKEERTILFGYDPLAGLQYIGATDTSFSYFHPTLPGATGRFEFYFNPTTGEIDVNHFGCNGTIFSGKQLPDGTISFSPPRGYPDREVFIQEFMVLRDKFFAKLKTPK
ncbi:MAG: hypothetical protein HYW88_01975 [Candidatus Sungbacteria bacterium]|nr:hypothetical protein [Candidatus Sungbacteria bacterium]